VISLFYDVNVIERYVGCFLPVHCRERILVIKVSRTVWIHSVYESVVGKVIYLREGNY